MRRDRNAKILATLGPATNSQERIRELFDAGADVFRMNLSHGAHEEHRERYRWLREAERHCGRPIGVLLDLQGPKLRVGEFEGGEVHLHEHQSFRLDLDETPGTAARVNLPHREVFSALEPGMSLLLNDGRIMLRVEKSTEEFAETTVILGGPLSDHKGVNLPGAVLPISPITTKDREDLEFGLELGVDWVALSFVQRAQDILDAKMLIQGRAPILAKIEKPAAVDAIDHILAESDAIMVARGDLGVEIPTEDVPSIQKKLVRHARRAGKPVVVATQMLDSMIDAPTPTRAEASDVANAVYDGADAVMLSAETAVGEYPVESVKMMHRIIARVERDPAYRATTEASRPEPRATEADSITAAARQIAHIIELDAIVCYTTSGSTAIRAARERPEVPVVALTPSVDTARRLQMVWGIHCVQTDDVENVADMVRTALKVARLEGFMQGGGRIAITAGMPFGTPGQTNLLRIASA